MTLIDLGDVAEPAERPGAGPVNFLRAARLTLAALSVVGLLALTSSAAPAPSLVRPLWTADFRPGDAMALDAATVYLDRTAPVGPREVTAYDLRTGAVKWSTPAGVRMSDRGVRKAGDVLLVPTEASGGAGTTALDAATGDLLWRLNGVAAPSVGSDDVVLAETDKSGATTGLRLVGLRDGRQVWKRATAPAEQWITLAEGGRPTSILTVTSSGETTVYGYADGAERQHARIPWNGVYASTLFPAGPYPVVVRTASAQTVATIYDSADLRPLWRSDETVGYVTGCGSLICVAGASGVTAREPATGRVLWQRPDAHFVWDLGGGRMLLSAVANLASATTALVDAATGVTIGHSFGGQQAFSADRAGSLLLLRGAGTSPDRTVLHRLDLTTGRQTPLGAVERFDEQDCQGTGGFLLCPRGETLTVAAVG
ncbi:hypothetical protein GCM10010172_79570 [Paractinoplanes ferrugineus]|uniref:Pyrrolo-quinoline quinone repeat domain-containing protein n=1 Tax=Paractinoplanes ferrugineus TaxID=113564 RepID=A0A919J1H7_9ACTN|nr:PQQ-binding-like beta-propeller repeat protein [Actinoplanes ferrugineus]GIE13031.1 hypothetical protein Afe05nite_48710 [Actinoplanes ferrugineus]